MNSVWRFLTSTRLAIVLTLLIVADLFVGTFILSAYADTLSGIDSGIFFFWLFDKGVDNLALTWWLFLLLALVSLLAIGTIASLIDVVIAVIARRRDSRVRLLRRLLSQTVHLGFVIVLVGHMVSSSVGLRTEDNKLIEGEVMAMPGRPGLSLRLDKLDVNYSQAGGMAQMDATMTLLEGERSIKEQVVRLNQPLLYEGSAVYITHHGEEPEKLRLRLRAQGVDETLSVAFRGERSGRFGEYQLTLGRLIPNFSLDDKGKAYSVSQEYLNPAQAIEVFKSGESVASGWVFFMYPNRPVLAFDGYQLFFEGIDNGSFAVLNINRDPGGIISLSGSLIFLAALLGLLLLRREGAELVAGLETG